MEAAVLEYPETEIALSKYEREWGNPLPTFNHEVAQARLGQRL